MNFVVDIDNEMEMSLHDIQLHSDMKVGVDIPDDVLMEVHIPAPTNVVCIDQTKLGVPTSKETVSH